MSIITWGRWDAGKGFDDESKGAWGSLMGALTKRRTELECAYLGDTKRVEKELSLYRMFLFGRFLGCI